MRTGTIRLSSEEFRALRESHNRGYSPPPETYDRLFFTIEEMTKETKELIASVRRRGEFLAQISLIVHDYERQHVERLDVLTQIRTVLGESALGEYAPLDPAPIPMLLVCPMCGTRHIDVDEFATKPHHTHACQSCGMVWRPAIETTVGVQYLPGFKNP